jgi:hypothetical protein
MSRSKCRKCGSIRTHAVKIDKLKMIRKPYGIEYYCGKCCGMHSVMYDNKDTRDFVFKSHLDFIESINRSSVKNGTCSSIWGNSLKE